MPCTCCNSSFSQLLLFRHRVILGGGVVKHHTCNANLMRNGADFSVYINTANEFDGSDAGASPDEAISWGKIKLTATPVKVCCDATLIFPLLVTQTFLKPNRRQQLLELEATITLVGESAQLAMGQVAANQHNNPSVWSDWSLVGCDEFQ